MFAPTNLSLFFQCCFAFGYKCFVLVGERERERESYRTLKNTILNYILINYDHFIIFHETDQLGKTIIFVFWSNLCLTKINLMKVVFII